MRSYCKCGNTHKPPNNLNNKARLGLERGMMSNAFDVRPFAIDDFMQRYWVETGDLKRITQRAAAKQLERNYGIKGPISEPHIEDLTSGMYLTVHDDLKKKSNNFASMLEAKKYAVRVIKTRIANHVIPMMEQATIPESNKSIARSLGKEVTGNQVVKDRDGNWVDSQEFRLDPVEQRSFMGSTRRSVMEQVDWARHDMRDGDEWYYPEIDRPDLEYSFGNRIPLSFSNAERDYLFDAIASTGGFRSEIYEATTSRRHADLIADMEYEEQLAAIAQQPELLGHNGGPSLYDDQDEVEDLIEERLSEIGLLYSNLTTLEQAVLVEVAKFTALDQKQAPRENDAWYYAGDILGKSNAHIRKIKENILKKAKQNG